MKKEKMQTFDKVAITFICIVVIVMITMCSIKTSHGDQGEWFCNHTAYTHTNEGYVAFLDCDENGKAEWRCVFNFKNDRIIKISCKAIEEKPPKFQQKENNK